MHTFLNFNWEVCLFNLGRSLLISGFVALAGVSAQADTWHQQALASADRFAQTIEVLDESLHEAYEQQSTPEFKAAIEDIHHIEKVLTKLRQDIPTAPFNELCQLRNHLYEDLVEIRLDLIALGLGSNPNVVQAWNSMANTYNNDLNRYFAQCAAKWSKVIILGTM